MKKKKNNDNKDNLLLGVFFCFILAIIITSFFLLGGKETYTSADISDNTTDVLVCDSGIREDSFFKYQGEINTSYKIKIIFSDNTFKDINYTYDASFSSNSRAEEALSWMHGDYNKYMTSIGIYQENLAPIFSAIKTEAIINLFIPRDHLNSGTAKIIFLGDDYVEFIDSDINGAKQTYENKGFTCQIN